ncbi:MAG: CoA-binding protein [Bacteroidetes bacterium]|nr:CoA-binding protein [Bacteroidota bacterium]MBU1719253.1 CoA-binding protein [Bacteroidota bacterium]
MKKTLVIGASTKPERYSYKAINMLISHGHDVEAVGSRPGMIDNTVIKTGKPVFDDIHTVSLYVNPTNQKDYYEYILGLNPQRIVFNPGTENPEFEQMAQESGIEAVEACTLVLLSTGQF